VQVVRHSRLLRRRGLGMEGTLNDIRMHSKVILLPTQSPHVCCARRPPRFQFALTLRLTRLPQRVYQCQNTCSEIGHSLVFECRTGVVGAWALSVCRRTLNPIRSGKGRPDSQVPLCCPVPWASFSKKKPRCNFTEHRLLHDAQKFFLQHGCLTENVWNSPKIIEHPKLWKETVCHRKSRFFLINTISNGGFSSLLYELIPECQVSILIHKEHQEKLRFVGK